MSKLGRNLVSGVRLFTAREEWESSFRDCFQGKSVATLCERAGSLWRFSEWLTENHLPVLAQSSESVIYRYVVYLRTMELLPRHLRFCKLGISCTWSADNR